MNMKIISNYKIYKILTVIILLFTTLGFRVIDNEMRWKINEEDPYLWIRLCDRNVTIEENTIDDPSDSMFEKKNVSIVDVMQSIIDDANGIFGSYLRLEMYPADVNNLETGSLFDATKAEKRIIEICEDSLFLASGVASSEIDGENVVKCKINFTQNNKQNVRTFISVLTHEIGHCLGLHHPQELVDSVMSYFKKPTFYRYQVDDKMGIRYLYPATIKDLDQKEHNTSGLSCKFRGHQTITLN
ncbi:MAG: matrixin family metalloprotease [Oligoflexia bacterium]|nr:matrixin family metalloprotease [Oligoflexia bacterium]